MSGVALLRGDARKALRILPADSARCCVTSPPYFALRDYSHPDQIGLEKTPTEFVQSLVGVFAEVSRVLTKDGSLWVVIGDTYARRVNNGTQRVGLTNTLDQNTVQRKGPRGAVVPRAKRTVEGLKQADLIGIPYRLAFALRDAGWWWRESIVWEKANAMPESVKSRCTRSHEMIMRFTRREFAYHAQLLEPAVSGHSQGNCQGYARADRLSYRNTDGSPRGSSVGWEYEEGKMRNMRDVWTINAVKGARIDDDRRVPAYPQEIARRCIRATSEEGDLVVDPFFGQGTTAMAARELGRRCVGVELDPDTHAVATRLLGL